MQVQAIQNNNATLKFYSSEIGKNVSFGAIYQPTTAHWNKIQESILNSIKKTMREPLQKFKGETAEAFYKSKGLDFEISPHRKESVYLTAYKGVKETGVGVEKGYTYSDFINIGEYDKNSEFRLSDIDARIQDEIKSNRISRLGLSLPLITGLLVVISSALFHNNNIKESTKPLIENVDSVINKAKAILPDTIKVLKKVKK